MFLYKAWWRPYWAKGCSSFVTTYCYTIIIVEFHGGYYWLTVSTDAAPDIWPLLVSANQSPCSSVRFLCVSTMDTYTQHGVPSYCDTSHSIHQSAFCGLVGYDAISQKRNTMPPSSFILNMGMANSSEIPVARYHQPTRFVNSYDHTNSCHHICIVIYIYIYIQFLTIIIRTSGPILTYMVRWSISDMCMVLCYAITMRCTCQIVV
jgi:hypothetical protein